MPAADRVGNETNGCGQVSSAASESEIPALASVLEHYAWVVLEAKPRLHVPDSDGTGRTSDSVMLECTH